MESCFSFLSVCKMKDLRGKWLTFKRSQDICTLILIVKRCFFVYLILLQLYRVLVNPVFFLSNEARKKENKNSSLVPTYFYKQGHRFINLLYRESEARSELATTAMTVAKRLYKDLLNCNTWFGFRLRLFKPTWQNTCCSKKKRPDGQDAFPRRMQRTKPKPETEPNPRFEKGPR